MMLPGESFSVAPVKVWLVMGEQGEYSDRTVWAVTAFREQAAAQRFVEEIGARIREAIGQGSDDLRERLESIDPRLDDLWSPEEATYWLEQVELR
jgi:hypothetical protein